MPSKKRNTSKHSNNKTYTKLSTSTSSSNKESFENNVKWLNNVIQGKSLIEIAIRKHKWNHVIKLIKENPRNWQELVKTNSDIFFHLFKAQKYKLVWSLHKKYPFDWSLLSLSYLISFCPHIATHEYQIRQIRKDNKGNDYLNIFNSIVNYLESLDGIIVWDKYLLEEINYQISPSITLPLLGYALFFENIHAMNYLISNNEYKIGQTMTSYSKSVNFIHYMFKTMISSYINNEKHIANNENIYKMLIKKIFQRQNINWGFKIKETYYTESNGATTINEHFNLLTYNYLVQVPRNNFNPILYEICKYSVRHIDPNTPDADGQYPLDIYMDGNAYIANAFSYIDLLIENGANKFNLPKKNAEIIKQNLDFVIENYDTLKRNLLESYNYIVKYIKNNNTIETLIKSRFDAKQRDIFNNIINFEGKNMYAWLFNNYNNINVVLSLSNYLSYQILPNKQLLTYQDYLTIEAKDRKLMINILRFHSVINGLLITKNIDLKNESYIKNLIEYNTHPILYKFPLIYKISKDLMKLYNNNGYVVTIGESLDKIIFLQSLIQMDNRQHNKYITLPFSGSINFEENNNKLIQKYCKYLYTRNIHPEQIVNKNTKITIIDFAMSGKGIFSFINMYYKICTKDWSQYKLNKLNRLLNIVAVTTGNSNLHDKLKDINLSFKEYILPYAVLSYLYDTDDYRCLKNFKISKWRQLDDIDFNEKHDYKIGKQINGCNLVRFCIIYKYKEFLSGTKKSTKKSTKTFTK